MKGKARYRKLAHALPSGIMRPEDLADYGQTYSTAYSVPDVIMEQKNPYTLETKEAAARLATPEEVKKIIGYVPAGYPGTEKKETAKDNTKKIIFIVICVAVLVAFMMKRKP
jgi:hypothetical protein